MLWEMINFGEQWSEKVFAASDEILVKHVERKIIEHLLQAKQKLLVDNTSISVDSRKNYLAVARQAGRSIGAIFLDTPVIRCLERNRSRPDSLPESVISNLAAGLEVPEIAEGYRAVLVVDSY
jgi:predicted kinase